MIRNWKGKRFLSLALALVLLMTSLHLPAPVYATNEEQTVSDATEKDPMIGKQVKFNTEYPQLWTNKTNAYSKVASDAKKLPAVMVIVDVYQFGASTTLYQLDAAEGYTWPAGYPSADFTGKYWIESTKVTVLEPCDKCGKVDCGSSHENWCDICKVDNCTNKHLEATVTDSQGKEQKITVAGDLPDGATLSVTVPKINGEALPNVYDIKVYDKDGNEWQPIQYGKTVSVIVPVSINTDYVDVLHFVDCYGDLNGDELIVDVAEFDEVERAFLKNAINIYGDNLHLAVEAYKEKPVNDGYVSFETNSFSVYVFNETKKEFTQDSSSKDVPFDNGLGDSADTTTVRYRYYATADTDFRFSTTGSVIFDSYYDDYFTVREGAEYIKLSGESGSWGSNKTVNVSIDPNTPAGTSLKVLFATKKAFSSGIQKACLVEIIIVRPISIRFDDNLPEGLAASDMPEDKVYNGTEGTGIVTDGNLAKFKIENKTPVAPSGTKYTFVEWNTSPDGNGDSYAPGADFTPKMDTTLYAIWDADNYYVDYDLNGGAGDVPVKTLYAKNSQITLPAPPSKANCIFLGWSVTADGKSALYDAGTSYTVNSDVTFYAIWGVELTINVTNGTLTLQQDGEYTATSIENAVYVGTDEKIFTKSGTTYSATVLEGFLKNAVFVYTHDSSMNAAVVSGNDAISTKKLSETQTQANISANGITKHTSITFDTTDGKTYYISFDSNGGTAVSSVAVKQNQPFPDTAFPPNPTKQGYDFICWTDKDGNEVASITSVTSNVTLYASWEAHKYNVTFDSNGGSVVNNITNYTVESENVELPIPTRKGYTFVGWKVTTAGGSWVANSVYSGKFSGMYGNVALTAQWDVNKYEVIYSGDNISIPKGEAVYGAQVTIQTPTDRVGYQFLGWKVQGLDGVVTLQSGDVFTMPDGNVVLTAVWEAKQFTITFVDGFGTTVGTVTKSYGEAVDIPKELTKEGYRFAGWDKTYTTMPAENVTITAIWTVDICATINNGGTIDYQILGYEGSFLEKLEWYNIYCGTGSGTIITFTSADGYRIVSVTINGIEQDPNAFTDDKYTYLIPEEGITGPLNIAVTTELKSTTLTVEVKYPDNADYSIDSEQGFVFDISTEGKVILTVAVLQDGYVKIDGLTIGKQYTVTLRGDWSWRYQADATAKSVTIAVGGSTVEFEMRRDKDQWLDGNDYYPGN